MAANNGRVDIVRLLLNRAEIDINIKNTTSNDTAFATGKYLNALRINPLLNLNLTTSILSSYILVPGMSILPRWFLGIVYFVFLLYLFVGISIISDIFMA